MTSVNASGVNTPALKIGDIVYIDHPPEDYHQAPTWASPDMDKICGTPQIIKKITNLTGPKSRIRFKSLEWGNYQYHPDWITRIEGPPLNEQELPDSVNIIPFNPETDTFPREQIALFWNYNGLPWSITLRPKPDTTDDWEAHDSGNSLWIEIDPDELQKIAHFYTTFS